MTLTNARWPQKLKKGHLYVGWSLFGSPVHIFHWPDIGWKGDTIVPCFESFFSAQNGISIIVQKNIPPPPFPELDTGFVLKQCRKHPVLHNLCQNIECDRSRRWLYIRYMYSKSMARIWYLSFCTAWFAIAQLCDFFYSGDLSVHHWNLCMKHDTATCPDRAIERSCNDDIFVHTLSVRRLCEYV